MAWDNDYRLLNEGEIIQAGDEVDICNNGWHDAPKWEPVKNTIGQAAPNPSYPSHRRYRRKITAEICFCPTCGRSHRPLGTPPSSGVS